YDGGHAPNAETFTNRVAVAVRSGSQATRRDLDGPRRDSVGSPSVSFPGAAGQRAATRGRQGTRTGLRRSHVRGEFRDFERGRGRVPGRFRTPAQRCGVGGARWTYAAFSGSGAGA